MLEKSQDVKNNLLFRAHISSQAMFLCPQDSCIAYRLHMHDTGSTPSVVGPYAALARITTDIMVQPPNEPKASPNLF